MNETEIRELKKILVTMSMYYSKELNDAVIRMYVADMSDLSFEAVVNALVKYRKDHRNRLMPLPADVRRLVSPELTDDDRARETSSRVLQAMSRFGSYRGEDARGFVGELGWLMIQRMGGWENVCRSTTDESKGVFLAQARELGKVLILQIRSGEIRNDARLTAPIERKAIEGARNDTNEGS